MGLLESTYKTGVGLALLPARTAMAGLEGAAELERRARREVASAADRALMASIDAALERLLADDVLDAALERLLSDDVIERVLLQLERTAVAQRVVERLLDDGTVEQIVQRVLAGPEAERILAATLEGPLVEETVSRLLENQAVWVLVDEIARSPSVTEAIAHQGTGFVDQVAERARERSRNADALLERVARRLVKRRDGDPGPPPALPEGPST
jgi:ribosomal protein S28E/S33